IETARAQVDRLVVMVAHHPSQTIPGELRKAWLEEIHPNCEIHLVPDELADDPREWADFTVRHLGRAPDVVFSSESYGDAFAEHMGSRHVMVDASRLVVPISGTLVREAPLRHLNRLEPCVRAHYVQRVVLIGAESTGKTTLAQKLAEHFSTVWVPEFARAHWERKMQGRTLDDPPPGWTREEFVDIALGQQASENAAARIANGVLICDTNAFATGTWFERYQHTRDPEVDAIGARDKVDLYLHTAPDVLFVQDGVRDGEKIREWMDRRFAEQLRGSTTPVLRIEGEYETRFRQAVSAIDRLLMATAVGQNS
ncbi:MAG: AAA family ATPase, partial [Vicinamibacteria bacterium]